LSWRDLFCLFVSDLFFPRHHTPSRSPFLLLLALTLYPPVHQARRSIYCISHSHSMHTYINIIIIIDHPITTLYIHSSSFLRMHGHSIIHTYPYHIGQADRWTGLSLGNCSGRCGVIVLSFLLSSRTSDSLFFALSALLSFCSVSHRLLFALFRISSSSSRMSALVLVSSMHPSFKVLQFYSAIYHFMIRFLSISNASLIILSDISWTSLYTLCVCSVV